MYKSIMPEKLPKYSNLLPKANIMILSKRCNRNRNIIADVVPNYLRLFLFTVPVRNSRCSRFSKPPVVNGPVCIPFMCHPKFRISSDVKGLEIHFGGRLFNWFRSLITGGLLPLPPKTQGSLFQTAFHRTFVLFNWLIWLLSPADCGTVHLLPRVKLERTGMLWK